uniref:3CxxC-type domain-containing protein n=2 Tax=Gasterosteus aculeatus aculeatus TaxID=481459 RepID=A0AAQ4QWJ1_GASAC|nr:receptor-transporting protein 3-like [Gasterosteus aculeatus aculeatus]
MEIETVPVSFVFLISDAAAVDKYGDSLRSDIRKSTIVSSHCKSISSPNRMSRPTDWVPSLWMETFQNLLADELEYEDRWNLNFGYQLTNDLTNNERKKGWKIFIECVHGNFQCSSCRKTWSSARVTLLFRYILRGTRGSVTMRPFGQICRSCQDDQFELPGFSEEHVENALLRLFAKIRKNCYGEDTGEDHVGDSGDSEVKTKPHEKALCQACRDGICCQDEEEEEEDDDDN